MGEDFQKTQANLEVTLDVNSQLTWAELFRFVELAKASGVEGDDPVGLAYDGQQEVRGLALFLHPEDVAPAAA